MIEVLLTKLNTFLKAYLIKYPSIVMFNFSCANVKLFMPYQFFEQQYRTFYYV